MSILGALMGFLLLSGGGSTATPVQATAPTLPSYEVLVTAYNAVPWQTDENPFETASGAYSNPEIIAARSRDLADDLPFGTIIELDGSTISSKETCGFNSVSKHIGYRVIEDTMNARYTNRVDVLLPIDVNITAEDGSVQNVADVLGICKGVTVRVVGFVDINHLPKTQAGLAALVHGDKNALAVK